MTGHARNFDEQNFDKVIVGFIGEVLLGIASHSSNLSNFSTVKLFCYTMYTYVAS